MNISLRELGNELQVSGQTINNWEGGVTAPQRDKFMKLIEKFGGDAFEQSAFEGEEESLCLDWLVATRVKKKPSSRQGTKTAEGGKNSLLSGWLVAMRTSKDFSREQLARKAAVTQQTIVGIELGTLKNPHPNTITKLEDALEATIPVKGISAIDAAGVFTDFNPGIEKQGFSIAGVCVFCDTGGRNIYVGLEGDIKKLIIDCQTGEVDKRWLPLPVSGTVYLPVPTATSYTENSDRQSRARRKRRVPNLPSSRKKRNRERPASTSDIDGWMHSICNHFYHLSVGEEFPCPYSRIASICGERRNRGPGIAMKLMEAGVIEFVRVAEMETGERSSTGRPVTQRVTFWRFRKRV